MKNIQLNEAFVPSDTDLESKRLPVVWIVVKSSTVENIFKVGFSREFLGSNGTMFGEGVYSSYYLNGAKRCLGSYGDVIIKAKIPYSYKGKFLIFTEEEAKIWYGDKWSIEDQLRCFTNNENLIYSLKDLGPYRLGRNEQNLLRKIGVCGIIYDWHNHGYGSVMARGGRDNGHVCVLPFDFKTVIPYAVSYDHGYNFEKKFDEGVRKNFEEMIDPVFLLKNRYEKNQIGKPVYVKKYGFSFVPVKRGYGQYNLVELGSGDFREVSPVWFRSMTKLDPSDGKFQIEYNGKFYNAIPWLDEYKIGAYEDPKEGWCTFDELINPLNESMAPAEERLYQGKYRIPSEEQVKNAVIDPENKMKNTRGGFVAYTVVPSSSVENIFRHGFSRAFAGTNDEKYSGSSKSWYGTGVYCNIGLNLGLWQLERGKYGAEGGRNNGALIQVMITGGLDRFLIFNEHYAKRVYGENYTIKDQVYKIFPQNVADSVWFDMRRIMDNDPSARENMHFSNERSSGLLQRMLYPPRAGAETVKKFENIFSKYNVRGVIYTGGADKLCVVAYDYSSVIPISVYNPITRKFETSGNVVLPNGTETKNTFSFNYKDAVNRMFVSTDIGQSMGHQFKKIEFKAIEGVNINGEETAYRKVQTLNGEYNYVDVNAKKKISDIDFAYATLMNPSQNNSFNFGLSRNTLSNLGIKNVDKISKMDFEAIPYAYVDPLDGEFTTFDELPETLKKIDASLENKNSND